MNKYYLSEEQFNSNKRIFEAYYTEAKTSVGAFQKALDFLRIFLSAVMAALTSARARVLVRVCGIALSLIGLIGVVGAIEAGSISIGFGLLLGLLMIGVEFFCLKKVSKN